MFWSQPEIITLTPVNVLKMCLLNSTFIIIVKCWLIDRMLHLFLSYPSQKCYITIKPWLTGVGVVNSFYICNSFPCMGDGSASMCCLLGDLSSDGESLTLRGYRTICDCSTCEHILLEQWLLSLEVLK